MRDFNQIEMVHDILQGVLAGSPPFEGIIDQDDTMVVNTLGPYVVGALDAIWWVMEQEEPEVQDVDAQLDWQQLGMPAGMQDLLTKLLYVAGTKGYELRKNFDKKAKGG